MKLNALRVEYGAAQNGAFGLVDLDGIDEFRSAVAQDYVSVVRGKPGPLGGLYELYIEVLSTFALSHVTQLLLDGMAFDLIKEGTHALVLKPFLQAYKRLRSRNNADTRADIAEFKIVFQDTTLILRKVAAGSVWAELERVLQAVARHHSRLVLASGEPPASITIPVLEDRSSEVCRFRVVGDFDETIKSRVEDLYGFWGIEYDYSQARRVYDVNQALLIDEKWLTLREYWKAGG